MRWREAFRRREVLEQVYLVMSGLGRKGEMNGAGEGTRAGALSSRRMAGTLFFLTGGTQRVVLIRVSRWFGGGATRGFRWSDCPRFFPRKHGAR